MKVRTVPELVHGCFRDYPAQTLENIYSLKGRVLAEIIKRNGNNDYKLPHRKGV